MEFDWNIFPGFAKLQLVREVQEFMTKMGDPSEFKGRIIFMSMFNDISWGSQDNEQECALSAQLVSICVRRFSPGKMVIPRTWIREEIVFYSRIHNTRRIGQCCGANDDKICRKRTPSFSVSRVHCHEERSRAKVMEKYQYTSVSMVTRLKLFFAQLFLLISSVFTEQSQICVKNCETCHDRTRRPVVASQSNHCLCQV